MTSGAAPRIVDGYRLSAKWPRTCQQSVTGQGQSRQHVLHLPDEDGIGRLRRTTARSAVAWGPVLAGQSRCLGEVGVDHLEPDQLIGHGARTPPAGPSGDVAQATALSRASWRPCRLYVNRYRWATCVPDLVLGPRAGTRTGCIELCQCGYRGRRQEQCSTNRGRPRHVRSCSRPGLESPSGLARCRHGCAGADSVASGAGRRRRYAARMRGRGLDGQRDATRAHNGGAPVVGSHFAARRSPTALPLMIQR